MKSNRALSPVSTLLLPFLLFLFLPTVRSAESPKPVTEIRQLSNGLRVVTVHFPGSTNANLFTFLPLSLATDAAGQAQWSHLVEHLVIRSTIPENSPQANAETLPDHMRLDFYGNTSNWKEGLSHHHRWLEGVPFTETNLSLEKPRVNQECDYTASNFATHKFAIAAWNQGFRHGQSLVKLKGDVLRATLPEVQRLRDQRLAISNQVTLCLVGGIPPATAFAQIEKEFSRIALRPPPDLRTQPKSGNLDLAWDLNASHLLLLWPIPDFKQADHAALLVAAQLLNQSLAADSQLPKEVGMIFAGADLVIPEGNFFYVSASLRPNSKFDDVQKAILDRVQKLSTEPSALFQTPFVAQFLSRQLAEVPSLDEVKSQVPPDTDMSMIEGNLGLRFGMNEHRYGCHRPALSRQIAAVTGAEVQRVTKKYLVPAKASSCSIRPQ